MATTSSEPTTATGEAKDVSLGVCVGCGKPASMQCPKCPALGMKSPFCGSECFKEQWTKHQRLHQEARARIDFRPPSFPYTGSLRPHWVSPMRTVPDHIPKPEYAITGTPVTEMREKASTKIHINTPEEIKGIREACRLGREIIDIGAAAIRVGVTTDEIDRIVHEATIARNAYPSPLNYQHFPKSCCTSVNEIICHGIPDARPLQDGDIVNLDISCYYGGYHADLNETYIVGKVDQASKDLIKTTYDSLMEAIGAAKPGFMCRDFGAIIHKRVAKAGFSVVRAYCGHGIGSLFHTTPNIPHYAHNKAVGVLRPGMVFTIEPMINAGVWQDETWPDDWTSTTKDGKRSAQFEHTLLITEDGCEILTAKTASSPPFFWEDEKTKTAPRTGAHAAAVAAGLTIPSLVAASSSSSSSSTAGAVTTSDEKSSSSTASSSSSSSSAAKKKKKKQAAKKKKASSTTGAATAITDDTTTATTATAEDNNDDNNDNDDDADDA